MPSAPAVVKRGWGWPYFSQPICGDDRSLFSVAEGGGATFMVSLSPASSELVTVAYATQDGTAVAGSDYTAASGTLQFDPGMTSHTIRVAVLNDTAVEPTETFAVELSDPVRATLADGTGVGTITDDVEHRVERAIRTGLPEVTNWRRQREQGALQDLRARRRGPKPRSIDPRVTQLEAENRRLHRKLQRAWTPLPCRPAAPPWDQWG